MIVAVYHPGGIAFPSEEAYYEALFDEIARERKTTPDKVRYWYFEKYMELCGIPYVR